ncbi:Uma2 family endonuclease [Cylindrospermopsis raciborskii]|uniref:Uma2 family endonuclease n=4 Tax=Cylindrospermopsis raciborskii TaxID=77022 RepID=UPI000E1E4745|nr:Uma2 family endonuclease [Cylindrospermopsis raciborskii]TPX28194.1 Uma2 family endonuclease [Cylindrospermopsis raciborskii GIHE 2018]UJS04024.1 Uma2 family endonuclease [Cylindrospermopsis raciborskii KLL07]
MVRQVPPKTQLGVIKSNKNQLGETIVPEIVYPESDGEPMADNTKQFTWIVKIKENLEILFKSNPHVFVAGDLFWYPIEGSNKIKLAPDTMVVFGRPKAHRGSYRQWEEDNIPPQVVFEILSPGNTQDEMDKKKLFYLKHGVEEYYVYDPDRISLEVSIRENNSFKEIKDFSVWTSPRLDVRFDMTGDELVIYYPDGGRFLSPVELSNYAEQEKFLREQANQRAEREKMLKEQETQRAEREKLLKEQETQRAEREKLLKEQERFLKEQEQQKYQTLLAQLKAKGIDITTLE